MKLLLASCCFMLLWGFGACTSKITKWEETLHQCIATSDSTHTLLDKQLTVADIEPELQKANELWHNTKDALVNSSDTLTPESMGLLDAFNVAYFNTKQLVRERNECFEANKALRKRLDELLLDLEQGNGNRAEYCANIQHEKEELTIIESHAKDIHRRFEELKAAVIQLESGSLR